MELWSYRGFTLYLWCLVVSYFMWSRALDSPYLHQSHPTTSLASHITNILISALL